MTIRTTVSKQGRRFLLRASAIGAGAVLVGCSGTGDVVGSHEDGGVGLVLGDGSPQPDDASHGITVQEGGGGRVDGAAGDGGLTVGVIVMDAGDPDKDGAVGFFVDAGGGG